MTMTTYLLAIPTVKLDNILTIMENEKQSARVDTP